MIGITEYAVAAERLRREEFRAGSAHAGAGPSAKRGFTQRFALFQSWRKRWEKRPHRNRRSTPLPRQGAKPAGQFVLFVRGLDSWRVLEEIPGNERDGFSRESRNPAPIAPEGRRRVANDRTRGRPTTRSAAGPIVRRLAGVTDHRAAPKG